MNRPAMPRSDPQRSRSLAPGLISLAVVLSMTGCSLLQSKPAPSPSGPYYTGLLLLAEGDFAGADQAFRESASYCESGSDGRRSLLFLSFMALDPRNPGAQADSAALMAARVLNLPNKTPDETLEAEALYVTALDRGADPELRIDPAAPGLAVRFGGCDQPFPPREVRPLPVLDNTTATVLRSADSERGALEEENQALLARVQEQAMTVQALQLALEEAQAELKRIRELMRLPDTSIVRYSPSR